MERSTHWLTGLLVLAIAGLGTVVVLELAGSVAIAPEVTAAAPPAGAVEAPVGPAKFLPPPERQFDEISNRPLFFPSRRPFVPPATTDSEPATTDDPTSIELIGVLLSEHGRAVLVQPKGQPGAHWVREQQTVAGWLVEEITANPCACATATVSKPSSCAPIGRDRPPKATTSGNRPPPRTAPQRRTLSRHKPARCGETASAPARRDRASATRTQAGDFRKIKNHT